MAEGGEEQCTEHAQPKDFFCFELNTLVCKDCTAGDHQIHTHKELVGKAPEVLFRQLDSLNDTKIALMKSMEGLSLSKTETVGLKKDMADKIEVSYKKIISAIQNQKKEVLKKANQKADAKLQFLKKEEDRLSDLQAKVNSMIEYTAKCVKYSEDDDLIKKHAEIRARMETELALELRETQVPSHLADFDVEVCTQTDIDRFCRTVRSEVIHFPLDPDQCELSLDTIAAELGVVSESSIQFQEMRLTSGKAPEKKLEIECHLKSLVNDSVIKCEVSQVEQKKYAIRFKPEIHGPNELIVKVNGKVIPSGRRSIPVSIKPEQRGTPVRIIPGFTEPWDVAVYSPANLGNTTYYYVTDANKIVKYDSSNKKVKELIVANFKEDKYKLNKLWGVDVDRHNGDVYVTGIRYETKFRKVTKIPYMSKKRKIIRFDSDLVPQEIVKSKGKVNLRGVMVTQYEVLACDDDKSQINVYKKEKLTELVRQISSSKGDLEQMTDISDMSSDTNGNYLYVSNFGGSCVVVFLKTSKSRTTTNPPADATATTTTEYAFLCSFGDNSNGVNMLRNPSGLCVTDRYVYVADWDQHNVSVYTPITATPSTIEGQYDITGGKYLCTFGGRGNGEGELFHPWGVAVDGNDFVYVCDQGNKRIQIF